MAITITDSVTLDESSGLQNTNVAIPGIEDNNDNDILVTSLDATFSTRLFTDLGLSSSFSTTNGAATNTVATLSGGSTLEGFVQDDGSALPVYDVVSGGPPPTTVATSFTTLDGEAIYLCIDSASGLGDNLVFGVDASGDVVFAAYITTSGSDVTISMVQFEAIDNPDTTNPDDPVNLSGLIDVAITSPKVFNFDTLPSGQNLFGTVGDADAAIVVIGRDIDLKADNTFTNSSDTINTSQGGGTVTIGINNQMFDAGEGAYFTYVTDPDPNYLSGVVGGLDQNEADDLDNVQFGGTLDVTGGFLVISQIQGNTDATLTIEAFLAPNADGADFDTALGTGDVIDITSITVTADGTVYTFSADGTQDGITVSNLAGVHDKVEIAGLGAGDKVEWTTATDHNQVLVEDVEGKFDIGQFGLTQGVVEHVDIGDKIRFEDDGPTAALTDTTVTVLHDETAGVDPSSDDQSGVPPADFTALGTVLGWAASASAVVTANSDFGTDGPGSETLSLNVSGPNADSGFGTLDGHKILLNLEGDLVVGRVDTLDDGSVDNTDAVAIAISLDATTGILSVAQYVAIAHPDASDPDDVLTMNDGALLAVVDTVDGDGDPDSTSIAIGDKVQIRDDGPTATGEPVSATVAEDDLARADGDSSDGNDDNVLLLNQDETSGTVATLVSSGTDAPATFSLSTDTSGLVSQNLTSKGDTITYSVNGTGDLLTATANDGTGDRIVFTLALAATGGYTFDLQDQIDHAAASGDAGTLALDLSSMLVATDADGDTVTPDINAFVINVENDVPVISAQILSGVVDFAAGDFVSNSLNGIIGADENTADNLSGDGTKTYTFTDYTTPTNVFPTLTAVLSPDKTTIDYYSDATLGTLVYDIVLDQDGSGEYTFTVHENPPPAFTSFDFSDLPSGQNLFGVIAADKADLDGTALLVIGSDVQLKADGTYVTSGANASDTINTSKGGGPVTIGIGNQMFDPHDGAFFVYLDNPDDDSVAGVTGGLTQKTADDADTIGFQGTTEVTSASVEISQVQGNTLATMDIFAYDIDNAILGQVDTDAEARAFALDPIADATAVNITGVRVLDANGDLVESWTDSNLDGVYEKTFDINLTDSVTFNLVSTGIYSARVSGLGAKYTVEFDTETGHDVADIEAVAGKFDIGGFNLLQGQDTPDQSFDFAVQITDYDSDVDGGTADAFANFSVGVDGTGVFDDGIA
ncbi:DUF5801 domain-containing protein [Mesorhizobium sp. M1338]|uniref:DUF5801 repeats-in-toxin domain-containing protein n=1 Tax=unclassified Mesorhizobium TaxID=325217 RepID=UPI003335ECBC